MNMMTAQSDQVATKSVLLNGTLKAQQQSRQTTTTTRHFFGSTLQEDVYRTGVFFYYV